jgi:hypothetical protein
MRRRGQGSASISAVVVFLSALLALGLMATVLPPVADVLSGFREGLRERGERGSELIRIYIHTANETENEPPIITIINGYDKESILTDYVVVARDGRILAAGKMGGSLGGIRIPAGARIDLTPADFGLSYGTFAAMADEVKAIYVRTAEGNSFGSSYGPPPKVSVDYQLNISQNTQHIIVIGTTTTRYNFTIIGSLPTLGDALVVKNVILVDKDGYVRGGVTSGIKWSDGSFDPNKIPDSVAALAFTDVVPINGYYAVPPFPTIPGCEYYGNGFWVYDYNWSCREVSPQFIEMIEFYPVEYYTPGSPVVVTAYYARYGGETQTIYNPDLSTVVAIMAQRPIWVQYAYKIPGTYTPTFIITYTSYRARVLTYSTTTVLSRYATSTYTAETIPITIWQEGGLVKFAPAFEPRLIYRRLSGECSVPFSGSGWKTCSFTINVPSGPLRVTAIKEVGYTITDILGRASYRFVVVRGPWGSYTPGYNIDSWSMTNLPVGDVTFTLYVYAPDSGSAKLIGWVVYEYFGSRTTATATLGINIAEQMKRVFVNGTETLSGEAMAHLAGTVRGGQIIKVKAPLVLLNYIYGIATSPPVPSSGGGGSAVYGDLICELEGASILQSGTSSPDSSTNEPLESISGGTISNGTISNFSAQEQTVTELRNVACRPVTPPSSLPSRA